MRKVLYHAVFGEDQTNDIEITQQDLETADIIPAGEDRLHILEAFQSQLIEVVHADYAARQFVLRINGKDVTVKLRDEVESRVHAMGFDTNRNHVKLNHVSSPMPGMVLKILVQEGQEVQEGDPVIVLEAMKMENVLNAPTNGVISKIHVTEKQNVDKNAILVELG